MEQSSNVDLGQLLDVRRPQQLKLAVLASGHAAPGGSTESLESRSPLTVADGRTSGDIVYWPIVLSTTSGGREVGYLYVEGQRLKFRWSEARGTMFWRDLMQFAVVLSNGRSQQTIGLRQLVTAPALALDFSESIKKVEYGLPVTLPADPPLMLRARIRSDVAGANSEVTFPLGDKGSLSLHESETLYLECTIAVSDGKVQIVGRTFFNDGRRPRLTSKTDLLDLLKSMSADLTRSQRELAEAEAEYENNTGAISSLEAERTRLGNNASDNFRRLNLTRQLASLYQRQRQLPKTGERLRESIAKLQATIANVKELGSYLANLTGTLECRLYLEMDGGETDLVVLGDSDSQH